MNEWVTGELASVDFSDKRLDKRMRNILDRVGSKPGASLPAACKGWDETFGAYRFFNNGKVTEQKVLSAHIDATRKRIAEHKVALCIQDTTEIDFTGRKLKGAGPLSITERIGFFNHVTLAVTPERLCLGVLDASMWARDFEDLNKHVLMKMGSRGPSLPKGDPVGAGWPCSTQAAVSQRRKTA